MLATRLLYQPRLPRLISISSQVRGNSKITHKDTKKNYRKDKHSDEEKSFINIAKEGRKLSEYDIFDDFNPNEQYKRVSQKHVGARINHFDNLDDLGGEDFLNNRSSQDIDEKRPEGHFSRTSARGTFNRKGLEEDFDFMGSDNKKVSQPYFRKPNPMANMEKLRMGEKIQVLSLLKRDSTPLFSDRNRSQLFVTPTSSTVMALERKTPFERELEESSKFLNSLLYSNPFKAKKEDPYDLNYPINNEDGQPAEKGVSFKEHVILDHLYEGFPKSGEIRNFMELVITGLSQNAYLTPEEKREHVDWFRKELETLSADDIKRMSNYVAPIWYIKKRRLKIKV